jgi:hypothetical protein
LLADPNVWPGIEHSVATGLSQIETGRVAPGAFWAYFHRPDELREELIDAGFDAPVLYGVEAFGWLLGDLEQRLRDPAPLLRALSLCETEPSMVGVSGHVIGVAARPS